MGAPRLRDLAREVAQAALHESHSGSHISVTESSAQARVEVRVLWHEVKPTPCEQDILTVLREQEGAPLTTSMMLGELDRRGMLHGESTVMHTLARMVRRGAITSSRKAPCGYRIAMTPAPDCP